MREADLLAALQARPFQPFRLYLLETTVFDVPHSEFAATSRSTLTLTLSPGAAEEREAVIPLMHITRMEPIQLAPPAPAAS